ncbi:MAG TPA: DNA polymerase III subunit gamma/tau [Xanthobacteraceae bacterium]|nr:DNA polymerase III subunit gamma/tau [Xanthobacteraceae bacterium]
MTDAGSPAPDSHQSGFDLGSDLGLSPAAAATAAGSASPAYRVLARKYRPTHFGDLIGQDAMVRTLSNAFATGRVPQAWILTGVRGVGKTTTARILARALNYELSDGSITGPTIDMPTPGVHCQAIMESRHIDVLEMDAASHTGIDDVRQLTDGARYAPTSARYKVYIIDEVHMMSEKAFNAFLKTLEEPPAHAKFVFATTEIRKVPITVLSRCQRFDLRRVDTGVLTDHLAKIVTNEGVEADAEALGIIARAAEGSVRDSLSLLDQAIAHAAGRIQAESVRQMLGLADRTRVIDLFESLMRGDIAAAFNEFRDQYDTGADPVVVLSDLAEFVNLVTRIKIVPATADNIALGEAERVRGREFASRLSMRILSRTWQMLLKGITEVQSATRPQAAAEMVLVRIAYAADLPTPDEAIKMISTGGGGGDGPAPSGGGGGGGNGGAGASATARATMAMPRQGAARGAEMAMRAPVAAPAPAPTAAAAQPVLRISTFPELVTLAGQKRDVLVKGALEADVRLVAIEDGRLEIALERTAQRALVNDLARKLETWTGRRWSVIISNAEGQPTLRAQAAAAQNQLQLTVQADPRVQEVLARWPGATIEGVRRVVHETPSFSGEDDEAILDDGTTEGPDED